MEVKCLAKFAKLINIMLNSNLEHTSGPFRCPQLSLSSLFCFALGSPMVTTFFLLLINSNHHNKGSFLISTFSLQKEEMEFQYIDSSVSGAQALSLGTVVRTTLEPD